jgi:CRISPR-associated endonuclease/helicase Cas3
MQNLQHIWAKSRVEGECNGYPLVYHLLDTFAVAERLLEASPRIACILKRATGIQDVSVIAKWVSLHDIGKLERSFQRRLDNPAAETTNIPLVINSDARHDFLGAYLLEEAAPDKAPPAVRKAIALHHAHRYVDYESSKNLYTTKERIKRFCVEIVRELERVFGEIEFAEQPDTTSVSVIAIQGFIVLCDWIASNETLFTRTNEDRDLKTHLEHSRKTANDVIRRLMLDTSLIGELVEAFEKLFCGDDSDISEPRPLQSVADEIELPDDPSLIIIEAPTGEGKTEAAITLVSRLIAGGNARGLFFALPTQATGDAMYRRVEKLQGTLYDDPIEPVLAHSKSWIELSRKKPSKHNDNSAESASTEWFHSSKKTLLAPLGVGTVDQAMMGTLQVRFGSLRLLGLSLGCLVIDEVHAYDVYMSGVIDRLLEWLRYLGTTTILLSATLPPARRRELILSAGGEEETTIDQPNITIVSRSGGTRCIDFDVSKLNIRSINIKLFDSEESVYEYLIEKAEAGAACCWIRNKVQLAVNAHRRLREKNRSMLFHARYAFGHRKVREGEAVNTFGKERGDDAVGTILVATQVVEQSLDLDFDVMVSDIAPVDLLVQRMGRLHRHDRERPDCAPEPELVVYVPTKNLDGKRPFPCSSVYDGYILARTYCALQERRSIKVPDDVPGLLEIVYGEGKIEGLDRFNDELKRNFEQKQKAMRDTVKAYALPHPDARFSDVVGFRDDDESAQALTRLGRSCSYLILRCDGDGLDWMAAPEKDESRAVTLEYNSLSTSIPIQTEYDNIPLSSLGLKEKGGRIEDRQTKRQWYAALVFDEDGTLLNGPEGWTYTQDEGLSEKEV